MLLTLIFSSKVHARRLAALKALTSASVNSSEILEKLYEIVFGILEKVCLPLMINSLHSYISVLGKEEILIST